MRLLFRLFLLLLAGSFRVEAQPSNAVAVTDFEMTVDGAAAKDWAFGLADVLAVELQQRGMVLFERQQIRVVLGERRITTSGLMQLRGNPAQEIPDLQYLVTGVIGEPTDKQFHLEVSVVEARTGRNVASFTRDGRYSQDLPDALAVLAEQIVRRLKTAGSSAIAEPVSAVSPVRTPEATLLFYKGVACCLADQPEMGVTWFIDAQKSSPNFLPARLWTMRAFEMLGLDDFAAIARAKVLDAPNGRGVLNRLNESRFLDKKLTSVAVMADPRLDAAGLKFQAALKTALSGHTNLFVADPSNIRSLSAEMDLQLAEKGGHDLESVSVLWSAMDVLVLVRADPSDQIIFWSNSAMRCQVKFCFAANLRKPRPNWASSVAILPNISGQTGSPYQAPFRENLPTTRMLPNQFKSAIPIATSSPAF